MKMIAGAFSRACLKRSRTRAAPTPTIISTNSAALIEKNGTPASPATAFASSVLPVPGAPTSSTPFGAVPPRRVYFGGSLEEVDDLDQLVLGLVDAGDVVEGDLRRRSPGRSGGPCSCRCPSGRRRMPPPCCAARRNIQT